MISYDLNYSMQMYKMQYILLSNFFAALSYCMNMIIPIVNMIQYDYESLFCCLIY